VKALSSVDLNICGGQVINDVSRVVGAPDEIAQVAAGAEPRQGGVFTGT
jgi:hypothetical protein